MVVRPKPGSRIFVLMQPNSRALASANLLLPDEVEAGEPETKLFSGKELIVRPCMIEGRKMYLG